MTQAKQPNWFSRLAHPGVYLSWSRHWVLPLIVLTILTFAIGLWFAFFNSPADYQMGETVRIMYIHVPNAWLSQMVYGIMAVSAIGSLVWRHPLADVSMKAAAPFRCSFYRPCFVYRLPLGPSNLGHLLGMGWAHDFNFCVIFNVCGPCGSLEYI